jgi:transaldolase/glucose-6-phosphate isomerase
MSRLQAVAQQGQSIWLDYIRRDLVDGGGLFRLVNEDASAG